MIGRPVYIDGVLIDDYVASQDLNECVEALIKKGSKHMQPEGQLIQEMALNKNGVKGRLQIGKKKSTSQSRKSK